MLPDCICSSTSVENYTASVISGEFVDSKSLCSVLLVESFADIRYFITEGSSATGKKSNLLQHNLECRRFEMSTALTSGHRTKCEHGNTCESRAPQSLSCTVYNRLFVPICGIVCCKLCCVCCPSFFILWR